MTRHGTIHIVRQNRPSAEAPKFSVMFADYQSGGGAMPTRELIGMSALADFLANEIGIDQAAADSTVTGLSRNASASILDVVLSDEQLGRIGFLGKDDPSFQRERIKSRVLAELANVEVVFDSEKPFSWIKFRLDDRTTGKILGVSREYHVSEIADWSDDKLRNYIHGLAASGGPQFAISEVKDENQLKRSVGAKLSSINVWSVVDQSESQFLITDHLFTHLVLMDASKFEAVQQAMEQLRAELKSATGADLEYLVRSQWNIVNVEYRGMYYRDGNPTAASAVAVILKSGNRTHTLMVAVNHSAIEELQRHSTIAENDHAARREEIRGVVKRFVELLLAGRGTAEAWDPLWQKEDLLITYDTLFWIRTRPARKPLSRQD